MGCRSQIGTIAGMLLPVLLQPQTGGQCLVGFVDAGEISASANVGRYQEVNVTKDLLLPKDIRLDESYRQKSIQAASDGAENRVQAETIPARSPPDSGSRSGGGYWWVHAAIHDSKAVSKDERGDVIQWKFTIDLYANTGGRMAASPVARGGAISVSDVRVRVFSKTRL